MKIFLDMVGCRLNQSEIEKFAFHLQSAGHQIVADAAEADFAIVNTCAVTAAAAADSRKVIRRIARAGCERIIATGCLSTVNPDQIIQLPSVTDLVSNEDKEQLLDRFTLHDPAIADEIIFRKPLPGRNKRTRAFIKVQDGCDNHCTFCLTRIARGKSRSIPIKSIFDDIGFALAGDVKEIVLTGVNLGSWGRDLNGQPELSDLIKVILDKFSISRLRLSSIEPWDVNDALLDLLQHPSFCHHFHLPLQSGSDQTLKRMGRRIDTEQFRNLIDKIRAINEDTAITTDIIVGFPGETDQEFKESLSFVDAIRFSGGHVFRYSPRLETPSYHYSNRIREAIKKERSRLIRELIRTSQMNFYQAQIGKVVQVLWEKADIIGDGIYSLSGLTENYLKVFSNSTIERYNELSDVKLVAVVGDNITGQVIE